jgi:hypothetical protein
MCKQSGLLLANFAQQLRRTTHLGLQPLVLSTQPALKIRIERVEHRIQRGPIESTVVIHPALKHRIDLAGDIHQFDGMPTVQPPMPDRLPNRFGSLRTNRRQKPDEEGSSPSLCAPGPKPIAQEVKLAHGIMCPSVAGTAVDDLRLLRMQLKMALRYSPFQGRPKRLRFLQAAAMTDHIVSASLESNARVPPTHPFIENVMQKEICQQRARYSPNAKGNFQFERLIGGWRALPLLDLRRKR